MCLDLPRYRCLQTDLDLFFQEHIWAALHSFYNPKLLLYVSNYLICVCFCFSKGIFRETSQTKIPIQYLIPILNIYHHALGKGNLAERVVYPYRECRITQTLSLSEKSQNLSREFLAMSLTRQKPFKFLTYLSLGTAVFCFLHNFTLLPKVCVDETRSAARLRGQTAKVRSFRTHFSL